MKPHTFRFDYKDALKQTIIDMVSTSLAEDLNCADVRLDVSNDITAMLIPEEQQVVASLICREAGVLCGVDWANEVFRQLDGSVKIHWNFEDGDCLKANDEICRIAGSARSILTGERTLMNFLQTLSATATETARYVDLLRSTECRLLDTRKTLPGFRLAQKYAVTCGGGHNHRIGLFDAFLIKENHILACGGIAKAIAQARVNQPGHPVEVEVEGLVELEAALVAGADVVMLDNFDRQDMGLAVKLVGGRCALEASGDITVEGIAEVAETGVDYISVGAITKNITALDLSLRIVK